MSNIQSAKLVLNNSSLNNNQRNIELTEFIFENIDLRQVLGDMFDKYDLFNLSLKSIVSSGGSATFGINLQDLIVNIMISGLPFINQTYDFNQKLNTSSTTLTSINFKRNDLVQLYFNEQSLIFSKNQEKINLKFKYLTLDSQTLPNCEISDGFPYATFIFDIIGIGEPKDVNQIVNQRII